VIIPGVDPNSTVYLNGEFLPVGQARVSVLDRGFIFGDGVYEVVPCYRGKPFRMAEHLARLARSLKALRIDSPLDDEGWKDLVLKLAETGPRPDSIIYLQVTRGAAKRDHAFPAGPVQPTVFGMASPYTPPGREQREQGLSVIGIEDERWLRCDIKSVSLLGNVLARQQAVDAGIWVVSKGRLLAPVPNHLILEGIRYGVMAELAAEAGVPYESRPVSRQEVYEADELMVTSATKEVLPIVRLDGRLVGTGKPGPVYAKLRAGYDARIAAL